MTKGLALIVACAVLAVASEPPRPNPLDDAPPIPVAVRLTRDIHVGTNLRYAEGVFRLHVDGADVDFGVADVRRITMLRPPPKNAELDPVLGIALRLASHRRARVRRHWMPYGVFILPDEPVADALGWLLPKVREPRYLALLCADAISHCLRRGDPDAAIALLNAGEKRIEEPDRAFVVAILRLAFLIDQERSRDIEANDEHLRKTYADRWDDVQTFRRILRTRLGGHKSRRPPLKFNGRRP